MIIIKFVLKSTQLFPNMRSFKRIKLAVFDIVQSAACHLHKSKQIIPQQSTL